MASDKKKKKNKQNNGKSFEYRNVESIDSVFNYVATINKGLKTRQLAFGHEDDMIDMRLPNDVELLIQAQTREDSGTLQITVEWSSVADADPPMESGRSAESKKKKRKNKSKLKKRKESAAAESRKTTSGETLKHSLTAKKAAKRAARTSSKKAATKAFLASAAAKRSRKA